MARQSFPVRNKITALPAPIGGWNARDAWSEMKPTDAIYLDNFIPFERGVYKRRGASQHGTGLTGSYVESLMEYNAPGANPKFFAATPNIIYDVSSAGSGSSVQTGLSNGRWQHTMFATSGGNFLVAANGADAVLNYDGSSWTTPAITGVTSSTLITPVAHVGRLWFIRTGTLKVYYLSALSVAGAATAIDFSSICKLGGSLQAMASWSRDGGAGLDDYAVFATTKGEILVYQGSDPASASTWALVGIFKAPEPIGRRCFIKLGADLCYLSTQGVLPLPQFLSQTSAGRETGAVTDKISGAFKEAYRATGNEFGWQVLEYPKESLLIVNVPIAERGVQHQYVMNLRNGAWCRFKSLNAGCWGLLGDNLYFGGNDGIVYGYGIALGNYADVTTPVTATGVQAFNDFGDPRQKKFNMARPLLVGPPGYSAQIKLLTDFQDQLPSFTPTQYTTTGPKWNTVKWNSVPWGTALTVLNKWQPLHGTGYTGALALSTSLSTKLTWNQTDVAFEVGRAK